VCNPQVKLDVTVNTPNSRLTVNSGKANPLAFPLSNHPSFPIHKDDKRNSDNT